MNEETREAIKKIAALCPFPMLNPCRDSWVAAAYAMEVNNLWAIQIAADMDVVSKSFTRLAPHIAEIGKE